LDVDFAGLAKSKFLANQTMTTIEATKVLASHGVKVDRLPNRKFKVWYVAGHAIEPWRRSWTYRMNQPINDEWTGREMIDYAKSWLPSSQQPSCKKSVKKGTNSSNRSKTRDIINTEEFDKLPNGNFKVDSDNIWNYD